MMITTPKKRRKFTSLFAHSYLDEYGLSSSAMRVLVHLARRANEDDEAWPSISSMVEICMLSRQTIINAIRELEGFNIIKASRRFGAGTVYTLHADSEWKKPQPRLKKEKRTRAPNRLVSKIDQSSSDTTPVSESDGHQSKTDTQRISREDTPLKDNTVFRPADPMPSISLAPVAPSQEPCPPGGSLPDGKPAMVRQDARGDSSPYPTKLSPASAKWHDLQPMEECVYLAEAPLADTKANWSFGVGSPTRAAPEALTRPEPKVSGTPVRGAPQTPIERKAYVIAEQLRFFHWDNCKVFFAKQAARAYAEGALRDGHDQQAIIEAYDATLRYCHGIATDEICDGKRYQHEKATPALTIWLARERLKGDPRTIEERWKAVIARLTVEMRQKIEKEARIRQEIAEKEPEIKAWFANRLEQDLSGQPYSGPRNEIFVLHESFPVSSHAPASPMR